MQLLFVLADVLVVALIGSILRGMSHRGSAAMDSGGEPVRTRMPTAAATNRYTYIHAYAFLSILVCLGISSLHDFIVWCIITIPSGGSGSGL